MSYICVVDQMKTKEKILIAALEQFNKEGFRNVTTRSVAKEMGISHGNLTYHFASREAILDGIYQNMVSEMEGVIMPTDEEPGLDHLEGMLDHFYDFQMKYRFFFQDLLEIVRMIPAMAGKQAMIVKKRQMEGMALIQRFVDQGIMMAEPSPGRYERLVSTIWFLNTWWPVEHEILAKRELRQSSQHNRQRVRDLIRPYLTWTGTIQMTQIDSNTKD